MSKARDEYYEMMISACDDAERIAESINNYVTELEREKKELVSAFKDLLDEAMYLYQAEEYFQCEKELLEKYLDK